MDKQLQIREIVKAKLETLHNLPFPDSPDREENAYASKYADLVLLDSQLDGLLEDYFSNNLNTEKKKQFAILRDALVEELDNLKDRKKDYIIIYFKELLEIINIIEI